MGFNSGFKGLSYRDKRKFNK